MPNINYPAYFPFANGDPIDPVQVDALFYDDTSAFQDSLAIINGGLDEANISGSWSITAEYTQRGSHVSMGSAARTTNLDWRYNWSGAYETDNFFDFDDQIPYKPIPGSCIEIYCKADSVVLLMWMNHWANDNATDIGGLGVSELWRSEVFLLVDGEWQTAQWRATDIISDTSPLTDPQGYKKARAWSGHCTLELDEGWHSIAICHVADQHIRLTRHWASSMKYICFTHPPEVG